MSDRDSESQEGTRVDLGSDLLVRPPKTAVAQESADDLLANARILASEGLLEEAKKTLRRIILLDPRHVVARKQLQEIHDEELKQIFSSEGPRRTRLRGFSPQALQERVDVDAVLSALDRELSLGVREGDSIGELSLFRDPAALAVFAESLDHELAGSSARDRIDLGVAFVEMGMTGVADRVLRSALGDPELGLSAAYVLASAHLRASQALEAAAVLDGVLGDTDTPAESRIDFAYLMGRSKEALGRFDEAERWYVEVMHEDACYRDVADRLSRLELGGRA